MDRQGIDRMDARLNALGASLFFDEVTVAHAEAAGIDDVFALYAGRAGVLGDVSAGQAASALGFFDPDVVNDVWEGLTRFGSPSWVAEVFAGAMADAAGQRWNAASARAVVALGMQVVESVTPAGASSVVHALRELRGDLHIQCVSAAGLHPLEAEMVTRGVPAAQLHGWKPPYPDPSRFVDRVAAAEAATSERMAHIYGAALSEVELDDLAAAVDTLAATGP